MTQQINSCRCGTTWTGLARAHCGACHRTFNTAGLFDAHRRDGACRDPASVWHGGGYLRQVDGIWSGPAMPERAQAAKRGRVTEAVAAHAPEPE
ncbi:hypothetical protein SAMN06265360_1077 [Haloechinothrix alba]|uniref:Phage FDXHR zinc binding domain-containing protein n=1 Tax=Haloechinothrix alba TaxID=664784 RepID=A0A238WMW0_9PSEU|nr:hypothetical protein SAMN06265360_1077 [Haloechinothrix alba]